MIDAHPDIVDKMERFGDWESDTIVGKAHKGFIASHVERKSKCTNLPKLPYKRVGTFNKASIKAFSHVQRRISLLLHPLTTNIGKEVSGHKFLDEMLNVDVYFVIPFCSWERGRNENMNRMVR
jgi:transposase, IS30 family